MYLSLTLSTRVQCLLLETGVCCLTSDVYRLAASLQTYLSSGHRLSMGHPHGTLQLMLRDIGCICHGTMRSMACLLQELSSGTWRAALQAEQRAVKDKVASVVQAGFTAFAAQCDLLSQRPKQDAAALAELMTPVLVEKVQPKGKGISGNSMSLADGQVQRLQHGLC